MASRYQTGAASSATDLLDKLTAFMALQGWASNYNANEGAGKRAHFSKGGVMVSLRAALAESNIFTSQTSTFTGLGINIATSYSSGSGWYAQPGAPSGLTTAAYETAALPMAAGLQAYAYHLFDDGNDNVMLVVEASAGIYNYLGFGLTSSKIGSWTGGAYFYGTKQGHGLVGNATISATQPFKTAGSAFMRASVDGASWAMLDLLPSNSTGARMTSASAFSNTECPSAAVLSGRGVSLMTGEANLVPMQLLVARTGGGWSYLANIKPLYATAAVGLGYSAGSTYTRGTDEYVLFPNFAVKK